MSQKDSELLEELEASKEKIRSAYRSRHRRIVIAGRDWRIKKIEVGNVEFLAVSPYGNEFVPVIDFPLSQQSFEDEMNARRSPLPDRKK